jgi:hypothetical protein
MGSNFLALEKIKRGKKVLTTPANILLKSNVDL